ncbi:MAG: cysteine hydrolase [Rhodospirillaceae bacterium]|nr:cysteine hydrolase [Rhodospirillaceae bacterium]
MHPLNISDSVRISVQARLGRAHAYDRLEPKKTALVVVDMQNYFVAPGQPAACRYGPAIASNINRLAAMLRDKGGKVYWVLTEALPDDADDWSNLYEVLGPSGKEARLVGLDRESEAFALWPEMDVNDDDQTVVKTRYSAMLEESSDLRRRLTEAGVDTILVSGVATNVCCEATARDSMMMGFRTIMVHDAMATFDDAQHNASLSTFYMLFGDVQSVAEVEGFLGDAPK